MVCERFRETRIGRRATAITLALLITMGTSPGLALAADTARSNATELTLSEGNPDSSQAGLGDSVLEESENADGETDAQDLTEDETATAATEIQDLAKDGETGAKDADVGMSAVEEIADEYAGTSEFSDKESLITTRRGGAIEPLEVGDELALRTLTWSKLGLSIEGMFAADAEVSAAESGQPWHLLGDEACGFLLDAVGELKAIRLYNIAIEGASEGVYTITAPLDYHGYNSYFQQYENKPVDILYCDGGSLAKTSAVVSAAQQVTFTIAPPAWIIFAIMYPAEVGGNVIDLAEASPPASGEGWTFSGGKYTILDGADVVVTGQTTQREVYVDAGASAHVTLQDATIDSNRALFVASPASLRLTLVDTNTLKSNWGQIAGISVRSGASLAIDGTGILVARGSAFAAGIGGDSGYGCGDITINGGTIHAGGGQYSSGIGASTGRTNTGTVTINGGTVYAARDPEATNRQDINASSITINGGSVSLANKSISPQPKDSSNANVYLNTLTVGDPAVPGAAATAGAVGGVACDAAAPGFGHPSAGSYGVYNVATDGVGKVFFWLPQTTAAQEVSLTLAGDDTPYSNTFARTAANDNASVLRQPAPRTPVTFTVAQTGGASGVAHSTAISLTFSEAVTGLAASDITIATGTGTATKGALSGSGTSWTLALASVAAEGTVEVSIGDFGAYTVANNPQSVAVYKDTRTWTASVNQTGTYTFPDASVGYDNTTLGHDFTITNTGNQPLTGVSAGFDAGSNLPFEFTAPLASGTIPVGGSATFSLRPKAGLSSGGWSRIHTDILRIRWDNDASGRGLYFVLRFTVNEKAAPTTSSLSFTLPSDLVYTSLPQGIGAVSAASGISGLGQISVYYVGVGATVYARSVTPPTNAGTYAVTADIAEGASYTAANGISLGEYSIAKAPQEAPQPPVLAYKTSWSIAFVAHDGYEYCVGYSPTGWMSSWTSYFEIGNLSEGYAHECYQRLAGDANHEPSPASEALIVVVGADSTPPTGEIKLGTHGWNSFINTITFGLFCKDTQTVTIDATDNSNDAVTIEYYLADAEKAAAELQSVSWVPYSTSLSIQPGKHIMYAKLTDTSGNSALINSDGIVIYTDSAQDTVSIRYILGDTGTVDAGVILNGNTIDKIMNGSAILVKNTDYLISGSLIMFKPSYLETLATGDYTLTVYYHPQGLEYPETPVSGSVAPQTTNIALAVLSAGHSHTWEVDWSNDASGHWHECNAHDGAKNGPAPHTPGAWIIDTAATATTDGSKHKECTVCGYVTSTETIPAIGGGTPALSSAKDVTGIFSPTGAVISGNTITANASNATTSQVIDLAVSVGASWKLYSNASCTAEIANKTMTLAVGENTAYVKVTAEDGSTKVYTVTITRAHTSAALVAGITVSGGDTITTAGGTLVLTATVTPEKASNKALVWSSSNTSIATVDANGKVTAKANGTAVIRATAQDGSGIYGEHSVTVSGQGGSGTYTPPVVYAVIDHFGTWTGGGTASARIDTDPAKFMNLTYNGAEVSAEHYTVTRGSTVITLAEAYLKTLAVGTHTYIAHFSDGYSENITLTVARQDTGSTSGNADKVNADVDGKGANAGSSERIPETGDNTNDSLWLIALLASALGLACLVFIAIKRR